MSEKELARERKIQESIASGLIIQVCRKCFDTIESGGAFMRYELEEGAVGTILLGANQEILDKFLKMLGAELTLEIEGKAKLAKHYTKALAKIDYLKIFRAAQRLGEESDSDEEADETVSGDEDEEDEDEKLKEIKKRTSSTTVKVTSKNLAQTKRDFDEEDEEQWPMEDVAERKLKKKKAEKRKFADATPFKASAKSPGKASLALHEGAPPGERKKLKKRKSTSANFSKTNPAIDDEDADGETKAAKKEKSMNTNPATTSAKKLVKSQPKTLGKGLVKSPSIKEMDEAENRGSSSEQSRKLLASMKRAFEREKEEILADIPKKYTDRLNEIAFAKWTKQPYRPVLIVNPYCLSYESTARKQWFKMYELTRLRRPEMTFLTYWYGTDVFDQAFTFQKGETLISHDQGIERGFLETLKKEINAGKIKMSKAVKNELINGISQYKEALEIPRAERHFPFGVPVEAHDMLDTQNVATNVAPITGESSAQDPDEEHVAQAPTAKKLPLKEVEKPKKKPKKQNPVSKSVMALSDEMDFAENEDTDQDSEAAAVKTAMSKKEKLLTVVGKSKKLLKKEQDSKKPRANSLVPKPKSTGTLTDEMSFAENEIETDEENEESYSEADEDDDFEVTATKRKKTKASTFQEKGTEKFGTKLAENTAKAKPKEIKVAEVQLNASKTIEKKTKIDRKRKKKELVDKKSISEPEAKKIKVSQEDKTRYRQEQRDFEKCELKYGELIVRWQVALEQDSPKSVEAVFEELTREVAQMSAPFIETREIAALLKKSKSFFETEARKDYYSKLRAILKQHYHKMKARVPEGFVPKKVEIPVSCNKEMKSEALETGIKAPKPEDPVPEVETSISDIRGSIENVIAPPTKKEFALVTPKAERISSLETKSADRGLEKKTAPRPAKMARMSLGSMLKTQSSSQLESSAAPVPPSFVAGATSKLSAWLTATPETNGCLNSTRALALEFFKEAATRFESDKVKPESVVRAVEKAVYDWSRSQTDEKKADGVYWEKVHAIVAGICGKDEQPGSLVTSISSGFFASPKDVASLSIDALVNHFIRGGL